MYLFLFVILMSRVFPQEYDDDGHRTVDDIEKFCETHPWDDICEDIEPVTTETPSVEPVDYW